MNHSKAFVPALAMFVLYSAFAATLSGATATITTDLPRYSLGQPMVISGTNFTPAASITVSVNRPDQTTDTLSTFADLTGAFSVTYSNASVPGRYKMSASDGVNSANIAATQADALATDFRQCSNDNPTLGTCVWINSILQQNNSVYYEGMSTLQRLVFDGVVPPASGNSHSLAFHLDAVKGGHHAYDFLTSWEAATAAASQIDTTQTLFPDLSNSATGNANACGAAIGPPSNLGQTCVALRSGTNVATANMPLTITNTDVTGNVPGALAAYQSHYNNAVGVRLYGNAPITNAVLTFVNYAPATGDQQAFYTLTWDSSSTQLLIEFGAHIAVSQDNIGTGYGQGLGASFINGGPYHVSITALDGKSLGSQDNQLKGSDILIPAVTPNVTTVLKTAANATIPLNSSVPVGTVVHDTVSVDSGSAINPIPTGSTVTFHRYTTFDCSGSSVDQVVSVTGGAQTTTAISASFTPTTGSYSYNAAFTSGNTGVVLNGTSTCEPFRVVDARIAITPLTATNEVTQPHTITATVSQDDGIPAGAPGDAVTGFGPAPDGTLVTFSLLNNAANATFVSGNTCTTTGGTCSIQIVSSTVGGVDIHATTTVSVGGQNLIRATSDGISGDGPNAHKDYVNAAITITPSATNEVNNQHVFTVTVTQIPGAATPASTANVSVNVTPAPSTQSTTCGATVAFSGNTATCTVTINSTTAGIFTANASATLTIATATLTRSTSGNSGPGGSGPAIKRYVDANISISPNGTNPVGTPHVFTITVNQIPSGSTPATTANITPHVNPVPGSLATTCGTAVPFSGSTATCTVTINSAVPGTFVANASVTLTVGGVTLTRATGDGKTGDSGPATKIYVSAILRIAKRTVPSGDTTVFTFTPTGWNGGATFPLSDGQTVSSGNIPPGLYAASEAVLNTFALTSTQCVLTNTAIPHNFTAIANGVSVLLGANEDVTCTFTNSRLPTLMLQKTIMGNSDTFSFTVTGNPTNPPTGSISLTPATNSSVQSSTQVIQLGSYVINEVNLPTGWLLTDATCTSNPASGAFTFTPSATGGTFTAGYGDHILCAFVDNQQSGATRTQGFWATHSILTDDIWNGNPLPAGTSTIPANPVAGSADALLCTATPLTATMAAGTNEVLGGFWANIAKISTAKGNNGQRSDLDQARMQFLQQYLAAVLNVHAFGTPIPGTDLATARAAYCGSDAGAIKTQMTLLGSYNSMGDNQTFTPGVSATTQEAKTEANIPFWDVTFR